MISLQTRLAKWQQGGLSRSRTLAKNHSGVSFCSNDYLALNQHPQVCRAFSEGAKKYGLGSGSSALVAGYHPAHALLEQRFADFLQRDKAILFNSGYHANIGIITAIANREWQIFLDRLCHASIIDAVILSRAQYRRYAHCDSEDLRRSITNSASKRSMIISEGIFSMEGDIAPLAKLAEISRTHQAVLMVDDAHGMGVLGQYGRGVCEYARLNQQQVPILVAPLGKALGSLGAVVAGSAGLIESLVQFSRTYRYTTALPPAIAHATLQALEIVENETWRRERLNEVIDFFITESKKRGISLMSGQSTPIQTILISDNDRVVAIQKQLSAQGIAVAAIRPPTVPAGTARLRISLSCAHSKKQIIYLLNCLEECRIDY